MNTQTKKALEMAIEALEGTPEGYSEFRALQACKEALAQPQPKLFLDLSNSNGNHPVQQEPVGIVYNMQDGYVGQMVVKDIPHKTKLYTHPTPSWQKLSDDEIEDYEKAVWYVNKLIATRRKHGNETIL